MILTTPGHDYAKPKPEKKYLVQAIGDKGSEDLDWKPHHCHVEDIEAKEAGEELARAREHAEWIDLQRAVQNLPLDLNLLIRDTMFNDIFGPGKEIIFPYEGPTYLQHSRALDRKLYEKYSSIYYCQNIWVIGKGSVGGLIETNEGATPTVLSKIKKVTLKWTWRDAMNSAPTRPFVQEYVESEMNKGGAERFDNLEVMEKFARICLDVEDELLRTWSYKLYELGALQLNNLVIDAREAFAPDGEFLGLAAAHRWEKSIRPPSHLHIWTPGDDNNDMAKQIFQIIAGKYS